MSKIKVMSESLANKIAAGEVVEKCASVVKELVENAIDAGATDIKVDLLNAGLKEIKITDNGCGMEKEDAVLSFSRHATSKLIREDDLFFINTLGFRGEALPSIAAVSEVELFTCASEVGTHIVLKGGKEILNEDAMAIKGTIIAVRNLFYNTPARLKYLKSEQYELSNTVGLIEKLALTRPEIKFLLTNGGKVLLRTSGSGNLLKTIHELYGLNVSSNMMEVEASIDDYMMSGYICKPEVLKPNRNYMITIVNGRIVRNNDLNRAINDAYLDYKPSIKFPLVVLKFETDPTLIDVNIHPTKQDIKLSKERELYEMIVGTIQDKLYQELLVPNVLKSDNEEQEVTLVKAMLDDGAKKSEEKVLESETEESVQTELFKEVEPEPLKIEEEKVPYKSIGKRILNPKVKKLHLEVIGQILGTYIVCQNEDGLFLIDQHAAKERVNYEAVTETFKNKEIEVTEMLVPINVEMSKSDFVKIKEHLDVLESMGFSLEEFGVNTLVFKKHPTWLKEGHEEEVIRLLCDEIVQEGNNFNQIRFNNKVIATIACKMSVRANTRLSMVAMQEIIDELVECDNPYNCAHGRPAIVKFSNYELEKMFKRVMN